MSLNIDNQTLVLILPGLFSTGLDERICKQTAYPEIPSLTYLLSNASPRPLEFQNSYYPYISIFPEIASYFKQTGQFPLAALSINSENNEFTWAYCLSPVYLHADMEKVYLKADLSDKLTLDEKRELLEAVNEYFNQSEEDKKWKLYLHNHEQLFLLSTAAISIFLPPPERIVNQAINQLLQTFQQHASDYDKYWQQTMTELQMFLFQHPLNQQRGEKSLLPINHLWFWGGGETDFRLNEPVLDFQAGTDSRVFDGICRKCKVSVNQLVEINAREFSGSKILYSERIRESALQKDYFSLIDILNDFEKSLFKPALELIKQKKISQLLLLTEKQYYYQIDGKSLKKWWQKKKNVLDTLNHD